MEEIKRLLKWEIDMEKLAGKRHRKRRMMCQDNTACLAQNCRQAAVLVDGIGQTDVNAKFGQVMADMTAAFLLDYFEEIRKAESREIAYNVMLRIERLISRKGKEYGVDKNELASTLLGVVIDPENDFFCCVHLGDGVIAVQTDQGEYRILSKTVNGRKSNETILTTSECALRAMEIQCGHLNDISGVLLASDGIYNSYPDMEKLKECFSKRDSRKLLVEGTDDQAFVRLMKCQKS